MQIMCSFYSCISIIMWIKEAMDSASLEDEKNYNFKKMA
jgi:hypothetical protein